MQTLVFDMYETLVDTSGAVALLEERVGEQARFFAHQWRRKSLEYSFRMGLMRWYKPFSECIRFGFDYTCEEFGVHFSWSEREALFSKYTSLAAYPDAQIALKRLSKTDATCFAFSNAASVDMEQLLMSSKLREYLHDIVSIESVRIFKPSRIAYAYLLERVAHYHAEHVGDGDVADEHQKRAEELRMAERECLHYVEAGLEGKESSTAKYEPPFASPDVHKVWLISSNPFDVIGAKVAGLQAVWVRRSPDEIFDPWGVEPTLTVANLTELYDMLEYKGVVKPT